MTPELAISSNLALYGSVFRAHGLPSQTDEHYWSTDAEPPPYYSRLVTRTRGASARDAQLQRLAGLATRAAGQRWGCKDSFDELPSGALASLGLRRLFRAWWYGWGTGARATEFECAISIEHVTSSAALLAWEEAWREWSPAPRARVFPDEILLDANLELFTVTHEDRRIGGFMLNRSDAAVGLSNVFQMTGMALDVRAFIRDCARHARCLHPDRTVVGYGPPSEVEDLASLGAVPLGPLTVWESP